MGELLVDREGERKAYSCRGSCRGGGGGGGCIVLITYPLDGFVKRDLEKRRGGRYTSDKPYHYY